MQNRGLVFAILFILLQPHTIQALEQRGSSRMDIAMSAGETNIEYGEQNSWWRDDSSKVYTDCSTSTSNACDSAHSIILGSHEHDDGWVSVSREFVFSGKSVCYSHAEIEMRIQTNGPKDSDNPGWVGAEKVTQGEGKSNKLLFYAWDYKNSNWDIINANSNYKFNNGYTGTVLTQNDGRDFRWVTTTIPLEGKVPLTDRKGAYFSNFADDELQEIWTDFTMQVRVLNHPAEDDWSDNDLRTEISHMHVKLIPKSWIGMGVSLSVMNSDEIINDVYLSENSHTFTGQGTMPDSCLAAEPVSVVIGNNGTEQYATLQGPQFDFSTVDLADGEVDLEFWHNNESSALTFRRDTTPPEGAVQSVTTDDGGLNVSMANMRDAHSGLSREIEFSLVGKSHTGGTLEYTTQRSYYSLTSSNSGQSFENLFSGVLSMMDCEDIMLNVKISDLAFPPNEKILTERVQDTCPEPQAPDFFVQQIFDIDRGGGITVRFNPVADVEDDVASCTMRITNADAYYLGDMQPTYFELNKDKCELGGDYFLELTKLSHLSDNLNLAVGWCQQPYDGNDNGDSTSSSTEEEEVWWEEEERKDCWKNSSKTTERRFVVDSHAPLITYQFDADKTETSLEIRASDTSGIDNLRVILHYENGMTTTLDCPHNNVIYSVQDCSKTLTELQQDQIADNRKGRLSNISIQVDDVFGNSRETSVSASIISEINDISTASDSTSLGLWDALVCLVALVIFLLVLNVLTSSDRPQPSQISLTTSPNIMDTNQPPFLQPTGYTAPFSSPMSTKVQTNPFQEYGRTDKEQVNKLVKSNPKSKPEDILSMYKHPSNATRVRDRTILKHIRRAIEANRPKAKPDIRQIKRLIVQSTDAAPTTVLKGYIHPPHKKQVDESVLLTIIADKVESIDKDRKDLNRALDDKTVIELLVFANSLGFKFTTRNSKKEQLLQELKNFILIEEPVSVLDIKRKSEVQPKGKRKDTPMGPIPFNFPFQCSAGAKKGVADGEVMCLYDHIDSIMKKPLRWLGKSCPVCEDGVVEQRITNIYFG